MGIREYYRVLSKKKIFSSESYDENTVPNPITFGEYIFEFIQSEEQNGNSYVLVKYYNGEKFPNKLIQRIKNTYLTNKCEIYSKKGCTTKDTIEDESTELYIYKQDGLLAFIHEMKVVMKENTQKGTERKRTRS